MEYSSEAEQLAVNQYVIGSIPITPVSHKGNSKRKKDYIIIPITKQEARYLELKGFMYHRSKNALEADLCKASNKRHPKYYLAPKKKLIAELEILRGCTVTS